MIQLWAQKPQAPRHLALHLPVSNQPEHRTWDKTELRVPTDFRKKRKTP